MYKEDLALNKLQCHKTQPNQISYNAIKPNQTDKLQCHKTQPNQILYI